SPGQVLPVDEWALKVDLAEVAREMPVPEERHALREGCRRAQHPVEPPGDQVLRPDRLVLRRVVRTGEHRRLGGLCLDQTVDGVLEAVLYCLLVLGGRLGESRAKQKMGELWFVFVVRGEPLDLPWGGGW